MKKLRLSLKELNLNNRGFQTHGGADGAKAALKRVEHLPGKSFIQPLWGCVFALYITVGFTHGY